MIFRAVIALLLVSLSWAAAPYTGIPGERTVKSSSGQFTINGPGPAFRRDLTNTQLTNVALVKLDPQQLAVTCERVKQALLRELAMGDWWRGRVRAIIQPYAVPDQPINIQSTRYVDGWHYVIEMPERIQPQRLVRGLVQVLLLEMANRGTEWRLAEVPLWLGEGLAAEIWAANRTGLVVLPQSYTSLNFPHPDVLANARAYLVTNQALTYAQLSLPPAAVAQAESFELYAHSAHVFVHALLRAPNGRGLTARFLRILPGFLNWQTAFLQAYQPLFPNLLAAEKWWALTLASFTGRDPNQVWSPEMAFKKLEETLQTPVLASPNPKEIPRRTWLTLQQVLATWEPVRWRPLLAQRVAQLSTIQRNLPTGLIPLAESYRALLDGHLRWLQPAGAFAPSRLDPQARARWAAHELVRQLNALDAKRAALQNPALPALEPTLPDRAQDTAVLD